MNELSKNEIIIKLGQYQAKIFQVGSLQELANVVEETLEEFIPTEWTGLYLFNPKEEKLRLMFAKGFTEEEKQLAEETAMHRHPGKVFREKIEINIPDVDADQQHITLDSPRSFHVKSRLYLPVMSRDKCVGTFGITSSRANRFTQDDIEYLRFICQSAGVVYTNIMLEEERMRVLEELRIKERAINSSTNGIIITDATVKSNPIIFANPATSEITGYSNEELIGENCRFLQGDDREQEGLNELRKALEENISCFVTLRNYRKDGTLFWNELSISPVFNSRGEVTNFIGVQRDITSRILMELSIQKANTRLTELIKNIGSGILLEDENRKIVLVNDLFCEMFGIPVSAENMIGADCSQSAEQSKHLFTDPENFVKGIEKILEEKKLVKNEELHLADGRIFERDYVPIYVENNYRGHLWNYYNITEWKKGENELRKSEERFRAIINTSPDAIGLFDSNANVVLMNSAAVVIFGYENVDEMIGRSALHFFLPEDQSKAIELIRQILTHGIIRNAEYRLLRKDGSWFYSEFSCSALYGADGEPTGIIAVTRDITQRKASELKLIEERQLLKTIIDNIPDPIYVKDKEGKKIVANKAEIRILNAKSEQEVIGKDDFYFYPAHVAQKTQVEDQSIINTGVPILDKEGFIISKEGNEEWFIGNKVPLKDISGNNVGLVGISHNITARKKIESELNNLKAFYEATLDDLPGQVAVFDKNFKYLYVNWESIKNPEIRNWLIGKDDFEYCDYRGVDRSVAEKRKEKLLEAQKEKKTIRFEEEYIRNDGTIKYFERKITPIIDHEGQIDRYVAYGIDITEIKSLVKNLEYSNKSLMDFAYIASHDLREPLRKISAFGSLLNKSLRNKLDDDDKENLDYMIDGAKRMQQMVDDLLHYSRITAKAKSYSIIDLDEVLNEIIAFDLAQMIEENSASITIENQFGTMKGEKTQIKQLFQNLISNGIKYRKKSIDPVIKIRSTSNAFAIEVQIEDNGIGIDEKYSEQIFEMFKRLHSKEEYEGSGIGLAVCKKIIELYKGEIELKSEPGKGSIFIFRLPVRN